MAKLMWESTDIVNATVTATENGINIESGTTLTVGSTIHIIFTPNEMCNFSDIPSVRYSVYGVPTYLYSTQIEGTSNYELTFTTANYTYWINPVQAVQTECFNIDISNLSNCTTNADPSIIYIGGDSTHIEVIANEGYYFSDTPYIIHQINGIDVITYLSTNDTGEHKKNYYIDLTFENSTQGASQGDIYYLYGSGLVEPTTDLYGIVTLYNPTIEELKQLSNVRYQNDNGVIDLGNFITNCIKVFVNIPQGLTNNINLGGYDTNVTSNVITDDIITVDCGEITINEIYGNNLDYEYTSIRIYLPLISFQSLDTYKVMNKTLHLIYKVNLVNGDSVACLYVVNNDIDTLLYSFECNASFEIPYKLNADLEYKGTTGFNSGYLLGFTPFIEIEYNTTLNDVNVIGNDNKYTTINLLSGYIKCNEVFNNIVAPNIEREEIETILKSGIII